MPLIQGQVSVAAASVNDNLLRDSQFEYLPYDAMVEFGLTSDAGPDIRLDVFSGQDILTEQMQPSSANRIPVYPDDFILQDVAEGGERLKIRVRNTHATLARTVFFAIRITEV